jgi:hypothetical protein
MGFDVADDARDHPSRNRRVRVPEVDLVEHEVEQEGESRVEATDDVEFHELVEDDPRRPTDIVDPGSEIAHQTHDGTLLLLG